jgi:hypothetical protein
MNAASLAATFFALTTRRGGAVAGGKHCRALDCVRLCVWVSRRPNLYRHAPSVCSHTHTRVGDAIAALPAISLRYEVLDETARALRAGYVHDAAGTTTSETTGRGGRTGGQKNRKRARDGAASEAGGALPPSYVCRLCKVPGHHIRDCPTKKPSAGVAKQAAL